jgi:phosphodiesterase/alkaline phosphatase D-like protein
LSVGDLNAVFIDRNVEQWLHDRTSSRDTTHLVHAPSNPFGWAAGKWGEWYPDVLDRNTGILTTQIPKPNWKQGWLDQHDRLMQSLTNATHRRPLVISGDLHAIGMGEIQRSGNLDLSANPVTAILSGPIGSGLRNYTSFARGVRPSPSLHLDLDEEVIPIEQNGFILVDFTQDKTLVRMFKWDARSQALDEIDSLQPFHTVELANV